MFHHDKELLERSVVGVERASQVEGGLYQALDAQFSHVHQVEPLDGDGVFRIWKCENAFLADDDKSKNRNDTEAIKGTFSSVLTGFFFPGSSGKADLTRKDGKNNQPLLEKSTKNQNNKTSSLVV